MQNLTNYIIGALVIAALGFLVYSITLPSKQPEVVDTTKDGIVGNDQFEQNIATHTEDVISGVDSNLQASTTQTTKENKKFMNKVTMTTSKGNIVLELNPKIAPKTVENFIKLANSGFYNGVKFHRVIKDFMIQSGDPNSKDDSKMDIWGQGGPGYKFEDEITDAATYKTGYKRGVLAMANSGPNTNGSQFFIMHKDMALPPSYTIFGHVISGIETVDAITSVKTLYPGQLDRPVDAITIDKVVVE